MAMKTLRLFLIAVPLVLILAVSFAYAQEKPIKLSWVSFLPKTQPETIGIQKGFADRLNKLAEGKLTIEFRGGPEAIPPSDLGGAVKRGIVDIIFLPVGFYEPLVPGVGGVAFSNLTLEEERQRGAYDYLVQIHEKAGLFYLGRAVPTSGEGYFYTYLVKKRLEKQTDFGGIKIGSATAGRPAVIAWGATPVSLKRDEYYPALERGVVDGQAGSTLSSFAADGRHELIKYVIDHPYYNGSTVLVMNLNSWNRLHKSLQNLMIESVIQSEKFNRDLEAQDRSKARQVMEKSGVEFYKLSPDVAKWYIDSADNGAWEYQLKKFPEVTSRLKQLLTK